MIKHLRHAAHHAKRFMHQAYHGTRKFLQNVDVYASMAKRILAASQPMLQDMGIQDQVMAPAMKGLAHYDQTKSDVMNIAQRGEDHYSRLAAAVQ